MQSGSGGGDPGSRRGEALQKLGATLNDMGMRSTRPRRQIRRGEAGVQRVTWMMLAWESVDVVSVDVLVDRDWAESAEKINQRKHDDERNSGEALVENASDACVEHGRSRIPRRHHGSGRGSGDAIDVKGLGHDRVWTDSNAGSPIASRSVLKKTDTWS